MFDTAINYHFRWVSAHCGTLKFKFHANGQCGSFHVRREGFDTAEYANAPGGVLYDFVHPSLELDKAFVDSFNDWAMRDHMGHVAHINARSHVYGSWDQVEAIIKPPRPVQGVVWRDGEYHPLGSFPAYPVTGCEAPYIDSLF